MKHKRGLQKKWPGLTSLTKERRKKINPHLRKIMYSRKIAYSMESTMRKKLTMASLRL